MEKRLIIIILLLVGLAGHAQTAFDKKLEAVYRHTVNTIRPVELTQKIAAKEQLLLLDTRSREEFEVSHLTDARLIEYDHPDLKALESLDKKTAVVVYCTVGYRSERIGERLKEMGFTEVMNLYGGIVNWKNEGCQVVNSKNQKTDSVHTYNKGWSQWLVKGIKVY